MSEPVYCARCNARIYGQVQQCCDLLLHGACYANHRKEHAR